MEKEFFVNNEDFLNIVFSELNVNNDIVKHLNTNEKILDYSLFEGKIISFIENVMEKYLFLVFREKQNCSAQVIENVSFLGRFLPDEKVIIINRNVIKNIWCGHYERFSVLFHELFHFKISTDMKSGKNDRVTKICLMEDLLRVYCFDDFGFAKNKKELPYEYFDKYYSDNYEKSINELYVNLYSYYCTLLFMMKRITFINEEKIINTQRLVNKYSKLCKSKNKLILENVTLFNTKQMSFEDAFNVAISSNPDWLMKYQQLSADYEINKDGKIVKKVKQMKSKR